MGYWRYFALILGLAAFVNLASASVITFEGSQNTIYDSPIVRMELLIGNTAGQEQHFHEIASTDYGLPNNGTGILLNDRDTEIYFAPNAGAPFTTFSLNSVDVAAATDSGPATGLTITGYLLGSPTGSIIMSIDGTWVNVNGSSLGTVDRVVFDGTGGGGGFVLDNFDFGNGSAAIPEPASFGLALLGFGALAILRRPR
jgi:hypothetical protein